MISCLLCLGAECKAVVYDIKANLALLKFSFEHGVAKLVFDVVFDGTFERAGTILGLKAVGHEIVCECVVHNNLIALGGHSLKIGRAHV